MVMVTYTYWKLGVSGMNFCYSSQTQEEAMYCRGIPLCECRRILRDLAR